MSEAFHSTPPTAYPRYAPVEAVAPRGLGGQDVRTSISRTLRSTFDYNSISAP